MLVGVCRSLLSILRASQLLGLTYDFTAELGLLLTIGVVGESTQLTVGVATYDKKV